MFLCVFLFSCSILLVFVAILVVHFACLRTVLLLNFFPCLRLFVLFLSTCSTCFLLVLIIHMFLVFVLILFLFLFLLLIVLVLIFLFLLLFSYSCSCLEVEGEVVPGHPLRHEEQCRKDKRSVHALEVHERHTDSPTRPENLGNPPILNTPD